MTIADAKLWDEHHPNLYTAKVSLIRGQEVLDVVKERFGIRKIEWNATQGLLINGKSVNCAAAVCITITAYWVHTVLRRWIPQSQDHERSRVQRHPQHAVNPISKAMLNACDELGMYIMDEAFDNWVKNPGMYGHVMY